jgi:hypothetical protein
MCYTLLRYLNLKFKYETGGHKQVFKMEIKKLQCLYATANECNLFFMSLVSEHTVYFTAEQNIHTGSGAHLASYSMGTRIFALRENGWGMKLTTQLHLVPMLRMSRSVLPLYASVA